MDHVSLNENRKWNALLAEEDGDRPLTWNDLGASDIQRFKLEEAGRAYAANPSAEILLEPLRRIYYDYVAKAEAEAKAAGDLWMGAVWWNGMPSDPSWPSSVRLSDLKAAVEEEENYRKAQKEEWEQRKAATATKSQATSTAPIAFASLSLATAPKK